MGRQVNCIFLEIVKLMALLENQVEDVVLAISCAKARRRRGQLKAEPGSYLQEMPSFSPFCTWAWPRIPLKVE